MAGFVGLSLVCCMIFSNVDNTPVKDAVSPGNPSQLVLSGLLGERSRANFSGRMLTIDEKELLAGFQVRPGKHPWIGEHVGKYLHAAYLTYQSNHDTALYRKITRVAKGLIACQEEDGYLGTYPKGHRFEAVSPNDWDVWVHKYCLIGLLAYYRISGDDAALETCHKAVQHLSDWFKARSISAAGTHEGMAATSILEPVLQLYQLTGDKLYLDFSDRLVEAMREKNGSHLMEDLKQTGSVAKTSNGKAYEMLSNLVGLCEMYRVTGKKEFLDTVLTAWKDITKNRLYLTGSGSSREHWTEDGLFPDQDQDNIAETCVTVTWMQLNIQLLRFTGESKYVDALEKSVYNHLLASQQSDGSAWCYYNPLDGARHPSPETTCCLSSGPRGIALIPTFAVTESKNGIDVNLYEPGQYSGKISIQIQGQFPFNSNVKVEVLQNTKGSTNLRLRIPNWVKNPSVKVNGESVTATPGTYLELKRTWKKGDSIEIDFPMPVERVVGAGTNKDRIAFVQGPLVLAGSYNCAPNPNRLTRLVVQPKALPEKKIGGLTLPGSYERDGYIATGGHDPIPADISLKPFFEIGKNYERYTVWFNTKSVARINESAFAGAAWTSSRIGNVQGHLTDGMITTLANTYTNSKADLDWYMIDSHESKVITQVEFRHGRCYWDGGWFDTSESKPVVQVRTSALGEWVTLGTLESYPKTESGKVPNIKEGALFALKVPAISVVAVRVVGKPASGGNPSQNFSSCAELGAF